MNSLRRTSPPRYYFAPPIRLPGFSVQVTWDRLTDTHRTWVHLQESAWAPTSFPGPLQLPVTNIWEGHKPDDK